MSEHGDHGRAGADGPEDPDCGCRGSDKQIACAQSGCGFCLAATKDKVKVGKYRKVRRDCFENDCFAEPCDVCHLHDEPADPDSGFCETCEHRERPHRRYEQRLTMNEKKVILLAMKWKRIGATHRHDCKTIEYPICSCGVGELCASLPEYQDLDAAITAAEHDEEVDPERVRRALLDGVDSARARRVIQSAIRGRQKTVCSLCGLEADRKCEQCLKALCPEHTRAADDDHVVYLCPQCFEFDPRAAFHGSVSSNDK